MLNFGLELRNFLGSVPDSYDIPLIFSLFVSLSIHLLEVIYIASFNLQIKSFLILFKLSLGSLPLILNLAIQQLLYCRLSLTFLQILFMITRVRQSWIPTSACYMRHSLLPLIRSCLTVEIKFHLSANAFPIVCSKLFDTLIFIGNSLIILSI